MLAILPLVIFDSHDQEYLFERGGRLATSEGKVVKKRRIQVDVDFTSNSTHPPITSKST